ncbi:MAG TPA: class I SAM-dependent methyltransferase [Nocardioidaceae bacterium]|jgi:cyclopropane fatty-acyl-phospholipid synthase-like methyltransferase|nr:class I SAM-dependent methyltransferase [Nocardioidaceae bacterium]
MTDAGRVRAYYDSNTWKFLLTSSHRALHRELWGPGVASRVEAAHHVHALVLDELGDADRRVLDLGCGVGTAALYLATRREVDVVGVSVSPAQVKLARRFASRPAASLAGTVRFDVADFTALPAAYSGFDLAFAIESFVHADPTDAFFSEAARVLRPGGALVVVDDVLVQQPGHPWVEEFRAGWRVSSLLTLAEIQERARAAGLTLASSRDLSGLQRLGRPRDRVVRAAQPALRALRHRSAWAGSMVGGDALQRAHRAGLLEYRLLRLVVG